MMPCDPNWEIYGGLALWICYIFKWLCYFLVYECPDSDSDSTVFSFGEEEIELNVQRTVHKQIR